MSRVRLVLAVAFPLANVLASPASAQTCAWGGTSAVPAPQVTALRSVSDRLSAPGRLAQDAAGNLYVADPGAGRVVVRDRWGRLISEKTGLRGPSAVAVDAAGFVFVAEVETGSVSIFDEAWNRVFQLGAGAGEFLLPNDIAIDPDPASAAIYVSDGKANLIRVFAANWSPAGSFGGLGRALGQLDFPAAVHVSAAGEVFVADQNNDRVQVFTRDGTYERCFGGSIGGMSLTTRFGRSQGITSDRQGRIYVADAFHGYVQVFDADGVLLSQVGTFGDGPGQLRTPMGLLIDGHNRLFVASANSGRLEVYGIDAYSDPAVIPAIVDAPVGLRLRSERLFVRAQIEVPGYAPGAVDTASVTANGVRAELRRRLRNPDDEDDLDDGCSSKLVVEFDLEQLRPTLSPDNPLVIVAGALRDGTPFEGSEILRLLPPRHDARDERRRDERRRDEHGRDEHRRDEHGRDEHGRDEHRRDEHRRDEHRRDEHGRDGHRRDGHEGVSQGGKSRGEAAGAAGAVR